MIVYYRADGNLCIFRTRDCYDCPVKKCVTFSDGLRRVECDKEQLGAIKNNKRVKIIKITEG